MAFRFFCVTELYRNLGKHDAFVEFAEIAIRDFIANFEENSTINDFDIFLQKKSNLHSIKVDTIDKTLYKSRIAQGYIFSVYQTFELFLRKLKTEHIELYRQNWNLNDSSDSLLIKILHKISNSTTNITDSIGKHRIEIYEYYRLVRNKYAHEHINLDKLSKKHNKVSLFKLDIENDYKFKNIPNQFGNINFDDFILFTRTVKDIADNICNSLNPDDEIFISYLKHVKMFKGLANNPKRRYNAIISFLNNKYGLTKERAKQIVDNIVPLA